MQQAKDNYIIERAELSVRERLSAGDISYLHKMTGRSIAGVERVLGKAGSVFRVLILVAITFVEQLAPQTEYDMYSYGDYHGSLNRFHHFADGYLGPGRDYRGSACSCDAMAGRCPHVTESVPKGGNRARRVLVVVNSLYDKSRTEVCQIMTNLSFDEMLWIRIEPAAIQGYQSTTDYLGFNAALRIKGTEYEVNWSVSDYEYYPVTTFTAGHPESYVQVNSPRVGEPPLDRKVTCQKLGDLGFVQIWRITLAKVTGNKRPIRTQRVKTEFNDDMTVLIDMVPENRVVSKTPGCNLEGVTQRAIAQADAMRLPFTSIVCLQAQRTVVTFTLNELEMKLTTIAFAQERTDKLRAALTNAVQLYMTTVANTLKSGRIPAHGVLEHDVFKEACMATMMHVWNDTSGAKTFTGSWYSARYVRRTWNTILGNPDRMWGMERVLYAVLVVLSLTCLFTIVGFASALEAGEVKRSWWEFFISVVFWVYLGANAMSWTRVPYRCSPIRAYPTREGHKLVLKQEDKKWRARCSYLYGPYIAGYYPFVACQCQNCLVRAVMIRSLVPLAEPSIELMEEWYRDALSDVYLPNLGKLNIGWDVASNGRLSDAVNAEWLKKFNPGTARLYAAELAKLPLESPKTKIDGHLKRELFLPKTTTYSLPDVGMHMMWSDPELETHKARVIAARDPSVTCRYGPLLWTAFNMFKVLLGAFGYDEDVNIYYTGNMSALQVGLLYQKLIGMTDLPLVFEADCTNWDGSVSEVHATGACNLLFGVLQVPQPLLELVHEIREDGEMHQMKVVGDSGAVVEWDDLRGICCSGNNQTTSFNTLTHSVIANRVVRKFPGTKVMLCGDDVVYIVPGGVCPEDVLKFILEVYKLAGMVPKAYHREDPSKVEFCSRLLAPAIYQGSEVTVLSPKLGRFLAKLCSSLNFQHKPRSWLKGVLVGAKRDVNHIRPLRLLVASLLSQLVGVKAVTPYDRDDAYRIVNRDELLESKELELFLTCRYGFVDGEYEELCRTLANTRLDTVWNSYLIDRLVEIDR